MCVFSFRIFVFLMAVPRDENDDEVAMIFGHGRGRAETEPCAIFVVVDIRSRAHSVSECKYNEAENGEENGEIKGKKSLREKARHEVEKVISYTPQCGMCGGEFGRDCHCGRSRAKSLSEE